LCAWSFAVNGLSYNGEIYQLPLPDGEGKALKPDAQPRPHLPIYLATLGPKKSGNDGRACRWMAWHLVHARTRTAFSWLRSRKEQKKGGSIPCRSGSPGDLLELSLSLMTWSLCLPLSKFPLAFSLGAMGSRQHNFYKPGLPACWIRGTWLCASRTSGCKDSAKAAIALVPDDLVLKNQSDWDERESPRASPFFLPASRSDDSEHWRGRTNT